MKLSSEMLQNLPYFWNKKIQIVFFISSNFGFLEVDVVLEIKKEKKTIPKNMANFEAFR